MDGAVAHVAEGADGDADRLVRAVEGGELVGGGHGGGRDDEGREEGWRDESAVGVSKRRGRFHVHPHAESDTDARSRAIISCNLSAGRGASAHGIADTGVINTKKD